MIEKQDGDGQEIVYLVPAITVQLWRRDGSKELGEPLLLDWTVIEAERDFTKL